MQSSLACYVFNLVFNISEQGGFALLNVANCLTVRPSNTPTLFVNAFKKRESASPSVKVAK